MLTALAVCGTILAGAMMILINMPHSPLRDLLVQIVGWLFADFLRDLRHKPDRYFARGVFRLFGLVDDWGCRRRRFFPASSPGQPGMPARTEVESGCSFAAAETLLDAWFAGDWPVRLFQLDSSVDGGQCIKNSGFVGVVIAVILGLFVLGGAEQMDAIEIPASGLDKPLLPWSAERAFSKRYFARSVCVPVSCQEAEKARRSRCNLREPCSATGKSFCTSSASKPEDRQWLGKNVSPKRNDRTSCGFSRRTRTCVTTCWRRN